MTTIMLNTLAALWLGILTSISPCQLATNIAAISYLNNRIDRSQKILLCGVLYTIGRILAYLGVGLIVITGLLSIYQLSNALQHFMGLIIGPFLIVVGLVLLEIVKLHFNSGALAALVEPIVNQGRSWSAGLLGIIFALTFCPISAALFFGSLIPLALKEHLFILAPIFFGIGTALPVVIFAILLAGGTQLVGKLFHKLTVIEPWLRRATAVILILIGIYLVLVNNFRIDLGF